MDSEAAIGAAGGSSKAIDTTRGASPDRIPGSMDTPVPSDRCRSPPLRGDIGFPLTGAGVGAGVGEAGAGVGEPGAGVGEIAPGVGAGVVLLLAGLGVGACVCVYVRACMYVGNYVYVCMQDGLSAQVSMLTFVRTLVHVCKV